MTRYLVERYLPGDSADEIRAALVRLTIVAERMTAEGTPVRHLGSTLMRDDDACFCELEAASAELVAEANTRARFAYARIVVAEHVA